MADVQLTASIDAAGFSRGINEMKRSLKDLQDTGNLTYDRIDSGFKSVENRLTSTGAAVRRLETAFARYATAVHNDLNTVANASSQVGQKVDAASQKMTSEIRNLASAVQVLQSHFTTLLQPIRNIDSQSAQSVTQLRQIVTEIRALNAAVQQTNSHMQQANGSLQSIDASTKSTTTSTKSSTSAFEQQHSAISSVKDIMQAVVALGFGTQLAKEVAEATGYMMQLEASFRVLLGSATEARNMMGDLVNFAMRTPFDLKGTADAAKQLLAYGVAADEVIETERRLGDIGAALGLTMRDLAYLYGTTKTQGRLYALDMRQFTTRGIPMLETLSKQLNVTTADITKMVTAGQIGFKEVKNAIWEMTDEGGQFGGLMEAQFNTIKGQLSNLGDAWYQFLAALGKSADVEFDLTDNIQVFNDKLMTMAANSDTIIKTLERLSVALAVVGAFQGFAWLTKTVTSMLAFNATAKGGIATIGAYNIALVQGSTIGGRLIASWTNLSRTIAQCSAAAAANGGALIGWATALNGVAAASASLISAIMPYVGLIMGVTAAISAFVTLSDDVDQTEMSVNNLAKAAISAETEIAKMYTSLLATTEGTESHTSAVNKLIEKLIENNVVSKEYCDSLTTETQKTQLLIDKKRELAEIERNKQIRSAADTQRETIITNDQDSFEKRIKEELGETRYSDNTGSNMNLEGRLIFDFDIDDHVAKEKLDALYSQTANMLGFIRTEMAVAQSEYNSGAITAAELQERINNLQAQGQKTIEVTAKQYAKSSESASELKATLEKIFKSSTTNNNNMELVYGFSSAFSNDFTSLVDNLTNLEAITSGMTNAYANPVTEYASILKDFNAVLNASKEGTTSVDSILKSVETLTEKLNEVTSDPNIVRLDIEEGALQSLMQFGGYKFDKDGGIIRDEDVEKAEDQIRRLVEYARENPTEFTSNIDEIEANMNSIVKKMDEDPEHWHEHVTNFTGELTALNNALNTGAKDIEAFKAKHGNIDINFGVIVRNNSLKLVEDMLKNLRKAFDALGLKDAVEKLDAAISAVQQRAASVKEKNTESQTSPRERLAEVRRSYKEEGQKADLETYNDFTTQELENRVKDIKSELKKQKDTDKGRKTTADLNEELAAINAELTQRSPSKTEAAESKNRKAQELARRERERKEKEEEKKRKAAEALDKLMRKHELALDEAADENILNEYKRSLEELENQLNKKNNSIEDELVSAENKAKESGRTQNKVMYGDEERMSYLSQEEINVFYNESIEAQKEYNIKFRDLEIEHSKDRLEFIEKYGSLLEQKLAYTEDYKQKIKKAEEEGKIYEAESLRLELDSKVQSLNLDSFRKSIDWETVFGNLDRVSTSALTDLRTKFKEQLSVDNIEPENAKVLSEKLLEIETKLAERTDFWSSLIPVLQERVRLSNEVADAEERVRNARLKEVGIQKSAISQISSIANISEEQASSQFGVVKGGSVENILKYFGIDGTTEAGQQLTATLINLSKATEDATAAEKHKTNLEDMLKGGSIGDIFKNAVASAGGGALGVLSVVNQNSQSMAEMVDKVGLGTTDFGQAVHGFADGVGGFTSAVGALMKGDVFGAINGVLDGVAGFGKMGISIFAGGGNEDEMEAEIAALAEANAQLSESINTLAKEINKSDNTNKESISYYEQAKLAEEQWEANQRKAIKDRASEYANKGYGFLGLGGKSSFNEHMAGNYWWGWKEFNRVLREHGLEATASKNNIWNLTPEQMQIMRDFAPAAWQELFNGEGHRNPEDLVNDYISHAGKLDELTSSLNEKLTGYSWEGFLDSYKDLLKDLESDTEDFADHINNVITNALIESFVNDELKKDINDLYKYIAKASKDGIDENEQSNIDRMNMDIANKSLAWRDSMIAAGRIKPDDEASQKASSGSFKGMTSDQADALEGRFTAVQGYVARVTEILEDWYKNGVIHRGDYTLAGSTEHVAYSPVVNPATNEVNVDFTDLRNEIKDVKEVMEKTNSNIVAFNTSFNTAHVDTSDTLDTIAGRTASLQRQEDLLRRMSKDVSEI